MNGRAEHELTVRPLPTAHRFAPGDDVAEVLLATLAAHGVELTDGDVLCVASKAVALSEGALLERTAEATGGTARDELRTLARTRATALVAESAAVTVTRTRHGFVAANGGIDRSNVPGGAWIDLPADPDRSAAHLRAAIAAATGRDVAVLVTDTFGRPWRLGQTDVTLGAAGLAVLRDERGSSDLEGRTLEVTLAAVADEIAGAADLVRTKASGTPFVLVRGLLADTAAGGATSGTGADLVRPLDEDLFRRGGAEAVLDGLTARRTVRRFDVQRPVPDAAITEAVAIAATAPAPHHTRPWRFVRLTDATRHALLDRMAETWRADLDADGVDAATIAERVRRSDEVHREAPVLLATFVDLAAAHPYPDARRTQAERDLFILSGGAAIEALLVALATRGLGSAWTSSTVFCPDTVRDVLGVPPTWEPLGTVAVGWPDGPIAPRSPQPADGLLEER